jgi:hypothetical protein
MYHGKKTKKTKNRNKMGVSKNETPISVCAIHFFKNALQMRKN